MCLVAIVVWASRLVTRLALGVIAVILILLSVGAGINAHFDYFPTLADALGRNGAEGSLHTLRTARPRSTSLVVTVTIPGRRSHFSARQALVYAPPAYFNRPRPQLPVIIMLHGTPGTPDNWVVAGDAQSTADAFARANGGVAPVLVMPDVNGSYTADTECVNSQAGNAESYLTRDVPAFIDAQLYVAPAGKKWAIAGFSEGGMCSVLLALRHDKLFTTFGDYGGLEGPRATENNNLGDTPSAISSAARSPTSTPTGHASCWAGTATWTWVAGSRWAPPTPGLTRLRSCWSRWPSGPASRPVSPMSREASTHSRSGAPLFGTPCRGSPADWG